MPALQNILASAVLIIGVLQLGIEAATLKFYHGSLNNYTVTQLEDPLKLLPYFNKCLESMFYAFGFTETPNSNDTTLILSAYIKTNYTNVILLDWTKEASKEFIGEELSYVFKAAPEARSVGIQFGQALLQFMGNGLDENKTHLVGHSLGAHVVGYAGGVTADQGHPVARITGLDPAGPLFEGLINYDGLNPSRAKFVDVLHTDPTLYGVNNSTGTVDFWANCNSQIQPGCPLNNSDSQSSSSFCSHQRSCKLYKEAILNPKSFPAIQANNCYVWGQNTTAKIIYLGDLVDTSAKGNFFFSTKSEYHYSKGQAGIVRNN